MQRRVLGNLRRCGVDQRGAALIEFVLVLPLVLILLFGMIDFGKAFNYWNDETHLANEAVRYAVVNQNPLDPSTSLETAVKNDADSGELKNGCSSCSIRSPGITVSFCFHRNPSTGDLMTAVGDPLTATVTTDYHWLAYLVGKGLPLSSGLAASATMRIEQPYKDNPPGSGDYTGNTYLKSGPVAC
jgi:Flp pilus assembly protein TadG